MSSQLRRFFLKSSEQANLIFIVLCVNTSLTLWVVVSLCQVSVDQNLVKLYLQHLGDYSEKNFQSCDADAAYPPGIYPVEDNSYSSFAQRWTGTITQTDGVETVITVGDTETPSTVPMTPSSSNCVTQSSLSMYVESESESDSPKPTSNNSSSSSNDDSSAPKSALAGVILTFSIAGLSALAILS